MFEKVEEKIILEEEEMQAIADSLDSFKYGELGRIFSCIYEVYDLNQKVNIEQNEDLYCIELLEKDDDIGLLCIHFNDKEAGMIGNYLLKFACKIGDRILLISDNVETEERLIEYYVDK